MNYDVIIIGGGPGGAACAKHLSKNGKKVALISKELGGECLNYGCIPTKTLLWTAELFDRVKEGGATLGIDAQNLSVNWPQMQKRRAEVVNKLKKQLAFSVQQNGVETIEGTAVFQDAHTVSVTTATTPLTLSAEHIVIATGSSPRTLPGFEWSERVLSNHEILELPSLPQSLLIIGGGVVGVEFASLFAGVGVAVTLAEAGPQLLPMADPDVANELERVFVRKKITVMKNAKITPEDAQKFEKVLVAVGRKPQIESLNLAACGVNAEPHGITINEACQTNVAHIYAIGDVTAGKWNLAYTAEREGVIVAENILGKQPKPLTWNAIPVTIFSLPEVAFVGQTEAAAPKEGVLIGKSAYSANAKALIMAGRDGFAKVIVDAQSRKMLGVHLVGERAADLIAEASLALAHNMTLEDFSRSLHSHPVLCEVLKEAMEAIK